MKPHEQRVIDERHELIIKHSKLKEFIGSPMFLTLPYDEQGLLREQIAVMTRYGNILGQRIRSFGS